MGLVGEVSGARLRDELVAILQADAGAAALRRMHDLALAQALHPALDVSADALEVVGRVDQLTADRLSPLRWRVRFAAIARTVGGDDLEPWLLALRVRKRDARAIALAAVLAPRLLHPLEAAEDARRGGRAARPAPARRERAGRCAGIGGRRGHISTTARRSRSRSTGRVLQHEFGLSASPQVGAVLAELLRQKQNGVIAGRDQELAAAKLILSEDEA